MFSRCCCCFGVVVNNEVTHACDSRRACLASTASLRSFISLSPPHRPNVILCEWQQRNKRMNISRTCRTFLLHPSVSIRLQSRRQFSSTRVAMSPTDIQTFAASQLALLELEHSAEIEETAILSSAHAPIVLQRAGLALLNLQVVGQRTGFAGRTQIDLALDTSITSGDLPEHGLSSGDLCAVAEQPRGSEKKRDREVIEARKVTGVVQRVRREDISVALDKDDTEVPSGGKLWLYVHSTRSALNHTHLSNIAVGTGRLINYFSINTGSSSPMRLPTNASLRQ